MASAQASKKNVNVSASSSNIASTAVARPGARNASGSASATGAGGHLYPPVTPPSVPPTSTTGAAGAGAGGIRSRKSSTTGPYPGEVDSAAIGMTPASLEPPPTVPKASVLSVHPVMDAIAIQIVLVNLPAPLFTAAMIFFIGWYLAPSSLVMESGTRTAFAVAVLDLVFTVALCITLPSSASRMVDVAQAVMASRLAGNETRVFFVIVAFGVLMNQLELPVHVFRKTSLYNAVAAGSASPSASASIRYSSYSTVQSNALLWIRVFLAAHIFSQGLLVTLATRISANWFPSLLRRGDANTHTNAASATPTATDSQTDSEHDEDLGSVLGPVQAAEGHSQHMAHVSHSPIPSRRQYAKAFRKQPLWASLACNYLLVRHVGQQEEQMMSRHSGDSWTWGGGTCVLEIATSDVAFACRLPIQLYHEAAVYVNGIRWGHLSIMPSPQLREALQDKHDCSVRMDLYEWTVLVSGLTPSTSYEIGLAYRGQVVSSMLITTRGLHSVASGVSTQGERSSANNPETSVAQPTTALAALPSLAASLTSSRERIAHMEAHMKMLRREHDKRMASKRKDAQMLERRLQVKGERDRVQRKLMALHAQAKLASERVEQAEAELAEAGKSLAFVRERVDSARAQWQSSCAALQSQVDASLAQAAQERAQVDKTLAAREALQNKVDKAAARHAKALSEYQRVCDERTQRSEAIQDVINERRTRRQALKAEFLAAIRRVENGIEQYTRGIQDLQQHS